MYDLRSFDFAAVHVIPLEVWFIIPRRVGIFLRARKAEFQVLRIRRSLALAEAAGDTLVGREHIRN